MAIGAQNAFVLKQRLKQSHVFWVCKVCTVSDEVLIFAEVAGFGTIVDAFPEIESAAWYRGALVLVAYGRRSFLSAAAGVHKADPRHTPKYVPIEVKAEVFTPHMGKRKAAALPGSRLFWLSSNEGPLLTYCSPLLISFGHDCM